mmetsp:Transcript_16712/g.25763  ORF Transcript_16712/g.25763 Transcript_16712/m.25763 type:complete len:81 (-) Transcript_16712:2802-3044(-)
MDRIDNKSNKSSMSNSETESLSISSDLEQVDEKFKQFRLFSQQPDVVGHFLKSKKSQAISSLLEGISKWSLPLGSFLEHF